MKKPVANMAASVRQRLLNLARERREDFGLMLTKYGLERILYRIAQSQHRELFVLKGALLFELWTEQRHRPTHDADFLARGQSSPERFAAIFKEICSGEVEDDGLRFDAATVAAERITEGADYEGIRVKFVGHLEGARIPIQIDLGFGDSITPAPIEAELPTLLDLPAAKLLTYPRESVIAEKFEAIVSLSMANSRMKISMTSEVSRANLCSRVMSFQKQLQKHSRREVLNCRLARYWCSRPNSSITRTRRSSGPRSATRTGPTSLRSRSKLFAENSNNS